MPLPALTLPLCFTCHHFTPSSAWIQRLNARMPECTFLGEFFKLTFSSPKRVCLVGLLYITLTAGITLTDSSLWNFYLHFNTSDGVQCYLPALQFPLCNHWWRQNSPGRTCPFLNIPLSKSSYYQMDPAQMWKSKYRVYLTNSRVVVWGECSYCIFDLK